MRLDRTKLKSEKDHELRILASDELTVKTYRLNDKRLRGSRYKGRKGLIYTETFIFADISACALYPRLKCFRYD